MAKVILVVDDDTYVREDICGRLRDRGLNPVGAGNEPDALALIQSLGKKISVAVLDMKFPTKRRIRQDDDFRGHQSGLRVARSIRERYPGVRLIGMSLFADEGTRQWFAEYGFAFFPKSWLFSGAAIDFIDVIENAARKRYRRRKPRTFIVHGHDSQTLFELVSFIQQRLKWPCPKILRELPSSGRTIIEKFEDATRSIDVVFVLLTPDDEVAKGVGSNEAKRRARQNVIFELGYFYAKLQRTGGRVILLYRGEVDLPSDIDGILYIDISNGVEAAGEAIRGELSQWLD
jgi:CheY-like chemotaxis protein